MNKTTEALKLAEEALQTALDGMGGSYGVWSEKCKPALAAIREALADQQDKPEECAYGCPENMVCDYCQGQVMDELQAVGQEIQPEYYFEPVLTGLKITTVDGQSESEPVYSEPKCNPHPDAPHGFARNASHNAGRYVCECEGWEPPKQELNWGANKFMPHEQPVKQEPVAYNYEYPDGWTTQLRFDGSKPLSVVPLYAAPADVKVIRAEALEEAAKVAGTAHAQGLQSIREAIVAAIRGLK